MMPSKKKKYNARFPAGRIKKIMQTDEDIGKVAQAVPVIISRTLELFVESLLKRAMQITSAKNAKTLTPTHMKQCILSESRFDFLKDLVKNIPDVSSTDDDFGTPVSNMSPATPLSAKVFSGYSCFQFNQPSDSSSSRSLGATSHATIPQATQPKFYKEIPIGSDCSENNSCDNSASSYSCGTAVIQHATGPQSSNHVVASNSGESNPSPLRTVSGCSINQFNELKLSNCIKTSDNTKPTSEIEMDEEDEEDDEDGVLEVEENGYHTDANIAKTCTIDEDYDT